MLLKAGLCDSGSALKDGNGDLTEIRGSHNQARNTSLNHQGECQGQQGCLPPHELPSKLPQGRCSADCSCTEMFEKQGVVCSDLDSPPQSHSAHLGSVSSGVTQVLRGLSREPSSLPEAERAAWEGKSPSRDQTSGGGGGRGMGHRNRQGQGPGQRKLPRGTKPSSHNSAHTMSWTGPVQPCILLSQEEGKEETVTRIWITCSGSNPSTETPFTSTNLSPAYNNPMQTGTQNKKGYKEIGKK